jgi:fructose-1,6-bisphosphatase/inositol monophosphatase family enzyme
MTTTNEGADLVLKLYDLRREAKMREARDWFRLRFNPSSSREVIAVLEGPQNAFFRMVVSYWDMAAALVNHGAIDEGLFTDVNVEHVGTFAKVEPFLADVRAALGNPDFLVQLERLVMRLPSAKARLAAVREQSRVAAPRPAETAAAPA